MEQRYTIELNNGFPNGEWSALSAIEALAGYLDDLDQMQELNRARRADARVTDESGTTVTFEGTIKQMINKSARIIQ